MSETASIEIIFQSVPGTPDLLFVEVEDGNGNSINIGQWSERDGYRVLTINTLLPARTERALKVLSMIPESLQELEWSTPLQVRELHAAAHGYEVK
jgi:hypothetical protein